MGKTYLRRDTKGRKKKPRLRDVTMEGSLRKKFKKDIYGEDEF